MSYSISFMFDVIIIGSGPAGLTAAIYTSRASLKTLIFAGNKWGGQLMLTTEVENFPGFPDGIMGPMLMANMRKQAERFGAKALDEEVTSVNFSKQPFRVCTGESSETKISSLMNSTGSSLKPFSSSRRLGSKIVSSGDTKKVSVARSDSAEMSTSRKGSVGASKKDFSGDFYQAKSIIVATGADTVWLGIPGERKLIGRGVSSCAPCDAFFFKNKKVIVVGGGDSAMEEALVLTKFAESVTIVHRRDSFRASAIMATKVQHHPKVEIIWNTTVEEIVGSEKVEKIKLKTGEKVWEMPIDGVFVAIGHKPNTALFKDILQIDKKGYIRKCQVSSPPSRRASIKYQNEKQKYPSMTSVEGVFVAGDVHDYTYRQAITAAGFGCEAAMDVERWLEEQR